MEDWQKDEELADKLITPRTGFYKSLGFSETDDELSFYCEREYAIPECLATTVIVFYSIDDESIVDAGKLKDEIKVNAFAFHLRTQNREFWLEDNDLCAQLHHATLTKFTETDVRSHVEKMIRDIETRLKNVFDLVRIS